MTAALNSQWIRRDPNSFWLEQLQLAVGANGERVHVECAANPSRFTVARHGERRGLCKRESDEYSPQRRFHREVCCA
jgi:hypothetical protein